MQDATPVTTQPTLEGVPLSALRRGELGRVCEQCLESADGAVLRAMGLRPNAVLRLCRGGEPCIVDVVGARGEGCRIGMAAPVARSVLVRPVGPR